MIQTEQLLNELERDALTELVNIGVSRAAVSLRKMVDAQVILSVPSIEIVTGTTAAKLIRDRENSELIAVRQDFTGAVAGRALLIFPEANSSALVRAVAGNELSADEVEGMKEEALAETGNILLNGCLASIANMLHERLSLSLPEVVRGDGKTLFEVADNPSDGVVIFFYINFTINDRDIRGYIAMLMDLVSIVALKRLIGEFIERIAGSDNA